MESVFKLIIMIKPTLSNILETTLVKRDSLVVHAPLLFVELVGQ